MIIAHLSDIHISRYGAQLIQMRGPAKEARGNHWEEVEDIDGWKLEARRAESTRFTWKDRLRLVDPYGTVHKELKVSRDELENGLFELMSLQRRVSRFSASALAADFPTAEQTEAMLQEAPDNANVRFCAVAHQLRADNPDVLLLTGDLTDDAVGFELIEAGFKPFVEGGRLIAIPGNHDIYPSPPLITSAAERRDELEKRRLWGAFARRIGVQAGGCFVRELGEGVQLICLDSAHPPRIPGSASGLVQPHELHQLAGELDTMASGPGVLRIACLHHHIANLPRTVFGSAPIQAGMKLRNAPQVLEMLKEFGVEAVLNGHRHIGFRFKPSGEPLFISAPSTTQGCKSGQAPFYWRLEVSGEGLGNIREVPIALLQEPTEALTA